jgi:Spy/CpxP family protein refolding chaperone
MRKVIFTILTVLLTAATAVMAQDNTSAAEKEMAYRKVVFDRSAKIVKALNFTDSAKALEVTKIVAKQYQDLNDIYVIRDSRKTTIKAETGDNKEAAAAQLKALEDETTAKIDKLHPQYLARLSKAGLTPDQVNQVKDGMTYNVLNVTMTAYNAMLPNLTTEQRNQLLTWLTEAREHAMDAESSDKKHAWFGKYKGRINNYLSAQGIDMKKEEAAWLARVKEEKENKQNNK